MNSEQWIGVLCVVIGIYFAFFSIWKRDFFLYKLKAQRVAAIFGETVAHRFYTALGVVLIIAGLVKASGVF